MSWSPRRFLIPIIFALYVLLHIATLTRTPLPWHDDTFFASMADSLSRYGTLHVLVEPIVHPKPLLLYGPAYFAMLGGLVSLFGVDVFVARLPGLIFGLAVIVMVYILLRMRGVGRG